MFYTYRQNNSGGSFVYDEERSLAQYVIVEADSIAEANERAEMLGIYFDGVDDGYDCECCGDRWYRADTYDESETPTIYGQPVEEYLGTRYAKMFQEEGQHLVFLHYKSGNVRVW